MSDPLGGALVRRWRINRIGAVTILAGVSGLFGAVGASAQVYWQPQPAPLVTAENEEWFRLGEPITFEGYVYYPAGARVFFDGNVMVRSGAYRGIPLYIDTTIEAYSRVFVPASGGVLQPYERRRTGDAAGTTGSRAPSFPVTMAGEPSREPGEVGTAGVADTGAGVTAIPVATRAAAHATARSVLDAGRKPKGLNEVYVTFRGYRWRSAGRAIPQDDHHFVVVGEHGAHPVYSARTDSQDPRMIYVPSRPGLLAPYERAGRPPKY